MSVSPSPVTGPVPFASSVDRRSFLGLLGMSAGLLALSSCKKDEGVEDNRPIIEMGAGETGMIRMAYAMEAFMVSFFAQAAAARLPAETALKNNLLKMGNFHQVYRDLLAVW